MVKRLTQARKDRVQQMNSEQAVERATADFTFLTGKRNFTQAMIFEKEDAKLVSATAQPSSGQTKRARFEDAAHESVLREDIAQPEGEKRQIDDSSLFIEGASIAELKQKFVVSTNSKSQDAPVNLAHSLLDLSVEDRTRLKRQITTYLDAKIDSVLPKKTQIKLTDTQKQCYMFMRSFQAGTLKPAPPKRSLPLPLPASITPSVRAPHKKETGSNMMQDFLSG